MDEKLDLSLPAVPPPPNGERVEVRARGLAGLIAGQESAVVYHRSDRLTAMVVVIDGRVVDAVAQTETAIVKGVDVLDELGEVPVPDLRVVAVDPRLARALPVYWRAPGATKELVGALVQPGRRGAVLASSPAHGTGIVVFDEKGIVASFADGEMRDEKAVDEILNDPDTVIAPRVEPRPARERLDLHPAQGDREPAPIPQTAARDQPSVPFGPPGDALGGWGSGGFGQGAPSVSASSRYGAPAGESELEPRRQAIVNLLQRELGRHAESVSTPFRTAPTLEALQGAAEALARESVRLISPTRMQNLSLQATAIARGEQPPT